MMRLHRQYDHKPSLIPKLWLLVTSMAQLIRQRRGRLTLQRFNASTFLVIALTFCGLMTGQGGVIDAARLPAATQRSVDFTKDIQPIFEQRCHECHGADKQKSGFRLDQKPAALKGGDQGVAIIPRDSARSPLIHYVSRFVPEMEMPPKGEPLTPEQIGLLRAWIDQGAVWPESASATSVENPLNWWSLRPLARAEPPTPPRLPTTRTYDTGRADFAKSALGSPPGLPEAWAFHPIDRFIYAKLAQAGLPPAPPANRRALIRRVYYDLLGLPPSPKAVEAFVTNQQPDAYAQLVDRLLASPHYGERWGRHWLDVVRFGESRGFERNEIINTAWPFRDYVIRSLNQDKPFDQFILEHLAGDIIGKDQPEIEVATTFLVAGPYDDVGNQDPVQAKIIRANTVDEMITATSAAFLGLTVNCARCHQHKFDPISMEDYYRLYAVLDGVSHGERTLATPTERKKQDELLKPIRAKRTKAQDALAEFDDTILKRAGSTTNLAPDYRLPKVDPHLTEDRFLPTEAQWVRLSILSNNRDPRSAGSVRIDEFEVWTAEQPSRNVALAANGTTAIGPARRAEDFTEAYSSALVIDGQYGARWITDGPSQLTIALPQVVKIDRICFSADRLKTLPATSGEIVFVGEYIIEVSLDQVHWTKVADSLDRPPLDPAFARERLLRAAMTQEDTQQRRRLTKALEEANAELRRVPPLKTVWAGKFEQPAEAVCIMKGGDPTKKGALVQPGSLSFLSPVTTPFELAQDAPEGERRLAFARWLVREDNPLTARVLANRVWHYHFGVGLVDTPSDFGKLGGLPTHPELLDWLAGRVRELGWRLKPLHREILLSQTYQQSAAWNEAAAKLDADSRLLWRFPPRRLSAEEIRDTMLNVAGVIDFRMGGPGFKLYRYLQDNVSTYIPLDAPGSDTYRRAVYHHNARASRVDLLTEFDQPDCAFTVPRRAATTSPLQALTLLNHRFTFDMAQALADRLEKEATTTSVPKQIQLAFALTYGRAPKADELAASLPLVRQHGLAAFCRAILNSNEMIYLE